MDPRSRRQLDPDFAAAVVIPAFNEETGLDQVLRQIYAAVRAKSIQVLVVDDGSTDSSGSSVTRWTPEILPQGHLLNTTST